LPPASLISAYRRAGMLALWTNHLKVARIESWF
jgi:hypothetical protein